MQTADYARFSDVIADLCTAFNRPTTNDLVRVFWESLKDLPYGTVRNRAELWRRIGKKFPHPAALRPAEESDDRGPRKRQPGPTTQERLCTWIATHYGPRLSPAQLRGQWQYLYQRTQWFDKTLKQERNEFAECIGVVIPADAVAGKPSYRIMVVDMALESAA